MRVGAVVSAPRRRVDVRTRHGSRVARSAVVSAAARARDALRAELGPTGVVHSDPATGGLRLLARIGGHLTGPSKTDAAGVTLAYVREHLDAFGLSAGDVDGLVLEHRFTSPDGVTHLLWVHTIDGVRVFDRDLRSNVDRDGRLLNLMGAPLHAPSTTSTDPELSPRDALAGAQRRAGIAVDVPPARASTGAELVTRFAGGDTARLTVFPGAGEHRLAWQVLAKDPVRGVTYLSLLDASSGRLLFRENLSWDLNGASVHDHYPGATGAGGVKHGVDFAPWLDAPDTTRILAGQNAHVWEDVDDNGFPSPAEEVAPSTATVPSQWTFAQSSFQVLDPPINGFDPKCPTAGCTWNPLAGNQQAQSWTRNSDQNAAQVFYFVNRAHDYFAAPPVGFTAAARGFEGADRLAAQVLSGARNQGNGNLDPSHLNNANMFTPPDGASPSMRMYLFATVPGSGDEWRLINGGDDAGIVYHEYVHAVTARTIVNSTGVVALGPKQSRAMAEGWSDWFAEDLIYAQGLETDTPGVPGEVVLGAYESKVPVGKGPRSQPLDCPPGAGPPSCPGTPSAGPGGFTYGDMSQVAGRDQHAVHLDGEIWGETLWDLRTRIGHDAALAIVSGGQKLTPPDPSMLDARNAILQSALTVGGPTLQHQAALTFAARGMGTAARTAGADDLRPTEDFTAPPAPTTCPGGAVVVAGTPCPPAPAPPRTATAPASVTRPLVRFALKPRYRKRRLSARLACPRAEVRCAGTLRVTLGAKSIASKRFSIRGGRRATVVIPITRSRLRKAAGPRKRTATLSLRAVAVDAAGNRRTTRSTLKVKI